MRIIGEIPHPTYKITVLKMNDKVTIQFEDKIVSQSFIFRDGSGIEDLEAAKKYVDAPFLSKVDDLFTNMKSIYISRLEELNKDEIEPFQII